MISDLVTEQKRLSLCNICLHSRLGLCMACGCVIVLKVKLVNTSCPIGRW